METQPQKAEALRLPLKFPEIDFDEIRERQDPFDPDLDIFRLKGFAEQLAKIAEGVALPFTLLLDGRWGTGKTVFLKQWAVMMERRHAKVVYFDAFKHDYQDDAFLALTAAVLDQGKERNWLRKDKLAEKLKKHFTQLWRPLTLGALVGVADALTAGTLGTALEKAAEAKAADTLAARLDAFLALEAHLSDFRKTLTEIAALETTEQVSRPKQEREQAAGQGEQEDAHAKPYLIVIIDELDRCRPDYALKVLELVKHVFTADGVFFLIAADVEKLGAIIRHAYGAEIDGHQYLMKFWDFQVAFPNSSTPILSGYDAMLKQIKYNPPDISHDTLLAIMRQTSVREFQRIISLANFLRIVLPNIVYESLGNVEIASFAIVRGKDTVETELPIIIKIVRNMRRYTNIPEETIYGELKKTNLYNLLIGIYKTIFEIRRYRFSNPDELGEFNPKEFYESLFTDVAIIYNFYEKLGGST